MRSFLNYSDFELLRPALPIILVFLNLYVSRTLRLGIVDFPYDSEDSYYFINSL
jgi:hypothetical protein